MPNKFVIFVHLPYLFKIENDQTASSSLADRFAPKTRSHKMNSMKNLLFLVAHHNAVQQIKGLYPSSGPKASQLNGLVLN